MIPWSQFLHPRGTTDFRLGGPVTFRRASKKKFKYWGGNMQNPDKDICGIYWADPGFKLVQADQSGADAYCVAYLCADGKFRSLFKNNVKPHTYLALNLFPDVWRAKLPEIVIDPYLGIDPGMLRHLPDWPKLDKMIRSSDNWPPNQRYYYIGKKICHSANYGMRAGTFQMTLLQESGGLIDISKPESERYMGTYHTLFPEIQCEFQADVRREILDGRTLRTLQGFPRYFGGCINDTFWNEAYSFKPQATVAIITENAYTSMQEFIEDEDLDWHLLNDKHDSLLVEAPEDEALDCARKSKEFMEQELVTPRGEQFKMRCGIQIGYNWKPKSVTNPDGLDEVTITA